jgi:signal transduction histidine kinase
VIVETVRLREFYDKVEAWPGSEAEMVNAAEKVARLLNASFAALWVDQERVRLGLKSYAPIGVNSLALGTVEAAIRKQVDGFSKNGEPFRVLRAANGAFSGLGLNKAGSFSFVAFELMREEGIQERVPGASGLRAGYSIGNPSEQGWLIVGTERPLSRTDELLLILAARRFSELNRVSKLEKAVQIRNQFLSIASHELKTPLTSIYGILQLQERMARLKNETPAAVSAKDQKRSYVKILLRQVERLNELIDGLLDVSRIQNGRFMVEPTEVDVAVLLREVVQGRLQVIAQEAGVKLSVDASENLKANVDPVRMEEVVTNLVMNAIRFSPEGGVVWIRLRQDGKAFRLTIRDQGPNVLPEDRERLFRPFERAQRTSRLGGLGLGLYISREIALMHGGNVSLVESVPGKGNVIEAYFPLAREIVSKTDVASGF